MKSILQTLYLIKQIFEQLNRENFNGQVMIRVDFNQGGIRNFESYDLKKREAELDSSSAL